MKIITVTANPALDITAHINNWERGVINRGQSVLITPGGKGINVAINLIHSGLMVSVTGWLGRDNDATFRRGFERDCIKDDFIRVEGETRNNVKIVDLKRDDHTDFNMLGMNINAVAKQELDDYLTKNVDESTVLVFGGSLPPGVASTFYAEMVAKFRNQCHFLAVDASGQPFHEVLQADLLPNMVKPNIDELREVTGKALETDSEIVTEARKWVAHGIKMVIISMGHEGAWFVTADEAIKALPLPVDVITTVGAGDAMVAGIIFGVVKGYNLAEIARTATTYSAANIETVGAGLPSHARIEALKSQVVIEQWD